MNINKKYCDRCGKEYEHYKFPQIRFKTKLVRISFKKIFSPDPYDYSDMSYDLCPKCVNDFETWLKGE